MRRRRNMKRRNPIRMMNQTSLRISDEFPSWVFTPLELTPELFESGDSGSMVSVKGAEKGPPPLPVKALTRTKYERPTIKLLRMMEVALEPTSVSAWIRVSFRRTSTCNHNQMTHDMMGRSEYSEQEIRSVPRIPD